MWRTAHGPSGRSDGRPNERRPFGASVLVRDFNRNRCYQAVLTRGLLDLNGSHRKPTVIKKPGHVLDASQQVKPAGGSPDF